MNTINSEDIIAPRLSQSKSYLKILDILYLIKDNNVPISSNVVKRVIKTIYIFNNITKSRVIKDLPKSDIAVI